MSPDDISKLLILSWDDQGAGRCWFGLAAIQNMLPDALVLAVGLNMPDSGRTRIHPDVSALIKLRYRIDYTNAEIRTLKPYMVTPNTIGVGFTHTPPPDFLRRDALDIFLAPKDDPFPTLGRALDHTANQTYLDALLLKQIITRHPEEIGVKRNKQGLIVPRYLSDFQPPKEPEYLGGYREQEYLGRGIEF